MQTGIFVC